MLKIKSQLGRALRYQSTLAVERTVGHFDDAAKDLAGPPSRAYREALNMRDVDVRSAQVAATRQPLARIDSATNSIVGYFPEEAA